MPQNWIKFIVHGAHIMNKTFAGIGSRQTPLDQIPIIEYLSKRLIELDFTLRSGGADGADTFWENAYDKFGGKKEIYLPWKGFNNNKSNLYEIKPAAMALAEFHHPAWDKLSPAAKKLHARNIYQILGYDLNISYSSEFVICWTPDAKELGGTAQAMRHAKSCNIHIFNLASPNAEVYIDAFLNLAYTDLS
jgi:hypothetical protein